MDFWRTLISTTDWLYYYGNTKFWKTSILGFWPCDMNFQMFIWNKHVSGYWTVVNIIFWADVNVKCHKIQYWGDEHNISAKFKFKFLETFKTWHTPVLLKTDLPQMTGKVFFFIDIFTPSPKFSDFLRLSFLLLP